MESSRLKCTSAPTNEWRWKILRNAVTQIFFLFFLSFSPPPRNAYASNRDAMVVVVIAIKKTLTRRLSLTSAQALGIGQRNARERERERRNVDSQERKRDAEIKRTGRNYATPRTTISS